MKDPDQKTISELDDMLCEADDQCIARSEPILSPLVRHDDGRVSGAFWRTVDKHKLRLPGEADGSLVERLLAEAIAFHGRQRS